MTKPPPKTRTPCHTPQFDCIATATRVLDRAVTKVYEDALRPLGLRAPQMTLLVVLSRAPGLTASQVAEFLVIDRSTLSRNITLLIENGWVNEEHSATDARARHLWLTPSGARMLKRAAPAWETAQANAKELLGERAASDLLTSAIKLMKFPS